MSKETQSRVHATWAIAAGGLVGLVGLISHDNAAINAGTAVASGGLLVQAGDFVCDRVSSRRQRSDNNQGDQENNEQK